MIEKVRIVIDKTRAWEHGVGHLVVVKFDVWNAHDDGLSSLETHVPKASLHVTKHSE